jgi:hypothetical protein
MAIMRAFVVLLGTVVLPLVVLAQHVGGHVNPRESDLPVQR